MLAVTFALADESREFLSALHHVGVVEWDGMRAYLGDVISQEALVFHTGMGMARSRERMAQFLEQHPRIRAVISAGYAGGLDPQLAAGRLFLSENYSTPALLSRACMALETLAADAPAVGRLITVETPVETCEAKVRLGEESGAHAVDMETSALAALCAERGLPFLSLRIISDTATEALAVPFSVCFDPVTERPRVGALLRYLLAHPERIGAFVQFVSATGRARQRLGAALVTLASAL